MTKSFALLFALFLFFVTSADAMRPPRPQSPPFSSLYVGPKGELIVRVAYAAFLSVDGGQHWVRTVKRGRRYTYFNSNSIVLDRCGDDLKCESENLDIGTLEATDERGWLYTCYGDKIKISKDQGKSWRTTNPLPESPEGPDECNKLAAHRGITYALGRSRVLYKSVDVGARWVQVQTDRNFSAPFAANVQILHMLIDKNRILYASTIGNGGNLIYASSDGGITWKRQTFGLPENWNYFVLLRALQDALYFKASDDSLNGQTPSFYRTTDGKVATKLDINFRPGSWSDIQIGRSGEIYMVSDEFIYMSKDGGKTWKPLNRNEITWETVIGPDPEEDSVHARRRARSR
jgi:photosystem II stability/assembly factor-like uncharacterized protein